MQIWIDLTNSPHVNFFAGMIKDLRKEHDVLLTCRPLADTVGLLKQKGLEFHVVGSHYGASKVRKTLGFGIRVLQLWAFLRRRGINVAISHSSFYSPVVARLLGVRSVYINDNEHAEGNRIAFLCATTVMVPEFLSLDNIRRQWGNPKKVVYYPGVKEGVYLSDLSLDCDRMNKSRATEIFIRPEPWTAQYYDGATNFLDDLIVRLKDKYKVVLMPRGQLQAVHYQQEQFRGITIPPEPLTLEDMAARCLLFIGAGGTMTREAAVMGIPTISVYQGALLAVDKYLIEQGYMVHTPELTPSFVESFIETTQRKPANAALLEKGAAASILVKDTLLTKSWRTP